MIDLEIQKDDVDDEVDVRDLTGKTIEKSV